MTQVQPKRGAVKYRMTAGERMLVRWLCRRHWLWHQTWIAGGGPEVRGRQWEAERIAHAIRLGEHRAPITRKVKGGIRK